MKDYCKHCNRWFSDAGDMSQLAINGYCIDCNNAAEAGTDDYMPDPLEKEVKVDCPECGRETTAQQLYLMGCCYDCSHKAGDC